jgi:hypothetical protein
MVVAAIVAVLDVVRHSAYALWRPLLGLGAVLFVLAGVLEALGRRDDSYAAVIVAAFLVPVGTALGVIARRPARWSTTQEIAP